MELKVFADSEALGKAAGADVAVLLRAVLAQQPIARMVVATGASQFATLAQLVQEPGIAWDRVELFHLDEYIGISANHPASFRKYIRERFINQIPPVYAIHYINGEGEPEAECRRLEMLLDLAPVDITLAGIGENGHLAFNDPPADFDTRDAYLVVNLEEACRKQQLGEGWFSSLDEVPAQAISMSIQQILRSGAILCSVPDSRKAAAVRNCMEESISPLYPASILRKHANCKLYLDKESAALLSPHTIAVAQPEVS